MTDSNFYLVCTIELASREDTSQTQKLTFISRAIGSGLPGTTIPVFATLKEITGLDYEVGNDGMPVRASGSIVLYDAPGSIGMNRRVVDLFERWEVVDRPVWVALVSAERFGSASGEDLEDASDSPIWAGRVVDWDKDLEDEDESLTLNIESSQIPVTSKSVVLDSSLTNDPGALGREIPILFSQAETYTDSLGQLNALAPGFSSGTKFAPNVRYYYATGLGDPALSTSFKYQSTVFSFSHAAYVRDVQGFYRPGAANTSGSGWQGDSSATGTGVSPDRIEYGRRYGTTGSGIILGARIGIDALGSAATPAGHITVRLYREVGDTSDVTAQPGELLATGTIAKGDYFTDLAGGTDFWIECRFDRAIPYSDFTFDDSGIPNFGALWVTAQHSQFSAGTDFNFTTIGSTYGATRGDSGEWVYAGTTAIRMQLLFCPTYFDQTDADEKGLSAAYVEFQPPTPPNNQVTPPIDALDVVVSNLGIRDNNTNDITGSGTNDAINRPDHVIKLLLTEFDGTEWVLGTSIFALSVYQGTLDEVFDPDAEYYRKVHGPAQGPSVQDHIRQIAADHAIKVINTELGLGIWAWGSENTVVRVFTDQDCKVTGYEVEDRSSIVNDVKIRGADFIIFNRSDTRSVGNSGIFVDMLKDGATLSAALAITEESTAIFGTNRNAEIRAPTIGDLRSARALGFYYLTSFDRPDLTIEFYAPWTVANDQRLAATIEIVSTALPIYFGGMPNGDQPTYQDARVDLFDNQIVKAKRYRAQITAKSYTLDSDGMLIRYRARVIGAYHKFDPT